MPFELATGERTDPGTQLNKLWSSLTMECMVAGSGPQSSLTGCKQAVPPESLLAAGLYIISLPLLSPKANLGSFSKFPLLKYVRSSVKLQLL